MALRPARLALGWTVQVQVRLLGVDWRKLHTES